MTSFALVINAQYHCRDDVNDRWKAKWSHVESLVTLSQADVLTLGSENLARIVAEFSPVDSDYESFSNLDWSLEELSQARADEVLAILQSQPAREYEYSRWEFGEVVWDLLTAMLDPIYHGAGTMGYVDVDGVKHF